MFLIKIFYSLLLAGSGILIIKYKKSVYSWTGRITWAERYLGSGGTIIFIILIGLLLIFLSVTYPFGVFDNYLNKNNSLDPSNKSETTVSQDLGNQEK